MRWITTHDLDHFLARVSDFLRSDPAEHTVPLTVVETLRERGSQAFGESGLLLAWGEADDGRIEGVALRTPPYALLLTTVPEQAAYDLAEQLAAEGRVITGVNADPATAQAFADGWRHATRISAEVSMRQRLYRLGELQPPDPHPPGAGRVAGDEDRDLLIEWLADFSREALESEEIATSVIDERLADRGFLLWEVEGTPVALGGRSRIVAEMTRVGPIYTPPEHRRHGYGAAVTAAVTTLAQERGAHTIVLFTDLANPTSNNVYRHLGYRPIGDRHVLMFSGPVE